MKTIALFPGLDGTGDLYAPIQAELSDFNTQIFLYPSELMQAREIAEYLLSNNDFSEIDLFVAESFGCRVLCELNMLQTLNKPSIFIAGFSSISTRYKLLTKGPDFLLKAFYLKAANNFALKYYCLGNTNNENLIFLLKNTLSSVPYETVIGRLRYLAKNIISVSYSFKVTPKFILAKQDKLLSESQQKEFSEAFTSSQIIEIGGPYFLAQTHVPEIVKIIQDSL